MLPLTLQQKIQKLPPRQGAYNYLMIDGELVKQWPKQRATRLVVGIDDVVEYSCGLNHLGDGNFFIIVANKWMKKLQKEVGDTVSFTIIEDPNPLGVEVPEVLTVLLSQDEEAKVIYDQITDGKKRSLIYSFNKIKNVDRQVEIIVDFLNKEAIKLKNKGK